MPRKFKPEYELLSQKVLNAIKGKPYAQALRNRTITIVKHVFDRWHFPRKLKAEHVGQYRSLLLNYANGLVDLQLPNETLLDRQIAGEMTKEEYLSKIISKRQAQPLFEIVNKMREFMDGHNLSYDHHFGGLWLEIIKAGNASPTTPENRN